MAHGFGAGVDREVIQICVVQTERDKHGRPIAVGVAVPLTVAGDAPADAGLIYLEVAAAFAVAQLGKGDFNDSLSRGHGFVRFRQVPFPICAGFQIGGQVAVAAYVMDMFFQRTVIQTFVTGFWGVAVSRCGFFVAIQQGFCGQARLCVDMPVIFGRSAAETGADLPTGVFVPVAVGFLQTADEGVFCDKIARVLVGVPRGFLGGADQDAVITIFAVCSVGLFQAAHKNGLHTGFFVGVVFVPVEAAIRQGGHAGFAVVVSACFYSVRFQRLFVASFAMGVRLCCRFRTNQRFFQTIMAVEVGRGFLQSADQFPRQAAFVMGVRFCFLQKTHELRVVAIRGVDVFLLSAESFAGHGNAGQLQRPEHA